MGSTLTRDCLATGLSSVISCGQPALAALPLHRPDVTVGTIHNLEITTGSAAITLVNRWIPFHVDCRSCAFLYECAMNSVLRHFRLSDADVHRVPPTERGRTCSHTTCQLTYIQMALTDSRVHIHPQSRHNRYDRLSATSNRYIHKPIGRSSDLGGQRSPFRQQFAVCDWSLTAIHGHEFD